jgi:hypothetical protein
VNLHSSVKRSGLVGSALAGGWRLVPIYQVQSGLPITPALSFDAANAGTVTRPTRLCDGGISNRTVQRYFDTTCFAAGSSYVFGNSGRNVLRAPGVNNFDLVFSATAACLSSTPP